jgi:hypothetical protein
MKFIIDLEETKEKDISVKEYLFLFLYYYKRFDLIKFNFKKIEANEVVKKLIQKEYIISTITTPFNEIILSNNKVTKLLGIKSDVINFWEFYNCYPIRVGTRVLRGGDNSQVALKHEKKYLMRVKTIEQHQKAIAAITAFVSKKKQVNELAYLPAMETVMNNSLWETWSTFVEEVGDEGNSWNTDVI